MTWETLGPVLVPAFIFVLFGGCAIAFFWGLFTGSVITDELAEGSWWRNKFANKDEAPLTYWFFMIVWGALTCFGVFMAVVLIG